MTGGWWGGSTRERGGFSCVSKSLGPRHPLSPCFCCRSVLPPITLPLLAFTYHALQLQPYKMSDDEEFKRLRKMCADAMGGKMSESYKKSVRQVSKKYKHETRVAQEKLIGYGTQYGYLGGVLGGAMVVGITGYRMRALRKPWSFPKRLAATVGVGMIPGYVVGLSFGILNNIEGAVDDLMAPGMHVMPTVLCPLMKEWTPCMQYQGGSRVHELPSSIVRLYRQCMECGAITGTGATGEGFDSQDGSEAGVELESGPGDDWGGEFGTGAAGSGAFMDDQPEEFDGGWENEGEEKER
ncbi:unnamed protein product [Chrysoparadoxa australica]